MMITLRDPIEGTAHSDEGRSTITRPGRNCAPGHRLGQNGSVVNLWEGLELDGE